MFHGAVIYFLGEHTTTLCFLDMHYGNVMFSGDGDYITMVTIFLSLYQGNTMFYPGQIATTGPCQSWPPNNPHSLDWLHDSLSSPPVAIVWWAHWRRSTVAAVASSKWMLHTGGGWGETPTWL